MKLPSSPKTVFPFLALMVVLALLAGCVVPAATTAAAPAAEAQAAPPTGAPPAGELPAGALPPGGPPPGGAGPTGFSATAAYTDVAYATTSGTQQLDIYLPEGEGPFPAVINFHAGGFKFGDKSMIPDTVGTALLAAGIAIVGVDYRLSDEAAFPAAVQDAMASIRFLRANAAQFNLNPDEFVAFGQSAGGNIASMVGLAGNVAVFNDAALGNADVSSSVQGVVNWFGPSDFGLMDAQAKAQGCDAADQTHGDASSFESAYIGAPVSSSPDLVQAANPITYITKDDPPMLLQKGDKDCTVPVGQSVVLADALSAAGLDVQYELLAGAGHGDQGGLPIFESPENVQLVVDWILAHVK